MDYDKVFVMTRVFFSRGFASRAFGLRTKMCDGKEENSGTQVSSPASRSTKQSGALRKKIFWDHFSKSLVTIQVFTSGT